MEESVCASGGVLGSTTGFGGGLATSGADHLPLAVACARVWARVRGLSALGADRFLILGREGYFLLNPVDIRLRGRLIGMVQVGRSVGTVRLSCSLRC